MNTPTDLQTVARAFLAEIAKAGPRFDLRVGNFQAAAGYPHNARALGGVHPRQPLGLSTQNLRGDTGTFLKAECSSGKDHTAISDGRRVTYGMMFICHNIHYAYLCNAVLHNDKATNSTPAFCVPAA